MSIDDFSLDAEAELTRLLARRQADDLPSLAADRGPMSSGQRQMWFFEQWSPGTATYHTPAACWVDGPLDAEALRRAYTALVARHGALRTRFLPGHDGSGPEQVVEAEAPAEWSYRDVSTEDDPDAGALAVATQDTCRPFDLRGGPPARLLLVRVSAERHLLVFTAHHMVVDGVALGVLLRDLDVLYRDRAAELPAVPARYLDFAGAESDRLVAGDFAGEVEFWRDRLEGAPPVLEVPSSRARPAAQTFTGRTVTFEVPEAVAARVRAVAATVGVTPFAAYLTVFGVLLSRYTGQEDLVVGTPVSLRDRAELAEVIGPMVNTVPVRMDLSGRPRLTDALRRTHDVVMEAFGHKDLPFERMVSELSPQRALTHSPIVQVVFGAQDRPESGARLGAARLEPVGLERGTAKFDLTWSIFLGERTEFEVEYNTDLFDAAAVAQLVSCYLRLLQAAGEPDSPVGELEMLTEDELAAVVAQSKGDAFGAAPDPRPLHELFAVRARRNPAATAVSDVRDALSYQDLDARSNRLARLLRDRGAGPGSVVGLCLDRGAGLVVALLAVLKSGAAYLPLDPRYPRERLAYMLGDARAAVVVTDPASRDVLPSGDWAVLDLDADAGHIAAAAADALEVRVRAADPAYVLYTSGTTGRPKAVEVTHANVSRLLARTHDWFGFDDTDVWTMFHSYAFDVSVWELWGALLYGGRLVIVPHLVTRSPQDFHELLCRERVTVLNQTPSAFRQLEAFDADAGAELALRLVIFAGEALDLGSVGRWFDRHGDDRPRLVNMYGITEITVHATYRPLTRADVTRPESPIGVPIPDLAIYVLDRHGNLLPPGVPGELHVGGAGVAAGYLGRPGLTAERFIADRWSGVPGARLYRSGDVGRWSFAGELEYLGRNDRQVKIRGFRIETGEIEAVLRNVAGVRAATVTARADNGAQPRLVAYVVGAGSTTGELREQVAHSLPDYMVPAVFVILDELPTTANGKIDYRRLPAPQAVRPELGQRYTAPRDDTERTLAEVWAEVLEVDRVGIHDSFFDLGGDSIRTLQAIGRAKERGLAISLQDLFTTPTIARLAARAEPVAEEERVREPFSLMSAEDREKLPDGLEDAYPMSVLQAGMVYHMTLDPSNLPYHNVNVFRVRAPFDEAAFRQATRDVVARHSILRTAFDLSRFSEPMQLVYPAAELPIEVSDLRHLSEAEQERRLLGVLDRERHNPFKVDEAPLLRYQLHRRSDEEFQWTITEHHAVFDGWSLFSTQAETLRRYVALLRDPDAPALPRPAAHFRDFIELEREAIASPEQRDFWAGKLADRLPFQLPHWGTGPDGPAPGATYDTPTEGEVVDGVRRWRFTSTRDAAHRSTDTLIPQDLCEAVLTVAAIAEVPVKTVLLAAYLKVLSLLSGRADVMAGVSTHGRSEDVDSTEVRGMFLNIPPVLVTVPGGTWLDLIRRTFAAEQEMLPHRRYPYAHMQWDAGSRSRLFDTSFLYNHFHVMSDVLDAGVEIRDGRVAHQAEYRVEPNSFSVNAGVLRNPRSNQMLWRVDYYTGKVSDELAEAVHRYYIAVLRAMARPEEPQKGFSPLAPAELDRLVSEWNGSRAGLGPDRCLHELVGEQVRSAPEAVAVTDGNVRLSYRDLSERADRLAARLREAGAGKGSAVAVELPPGADLVVAVLAVCRTGAAFLLAPAGKGAGQQRVSALVTVAPDGHPAVRAAGAGTGPSATALCDVDPMDPACVVGGQAIAHRALTGYLVWARREYGERLAGGVPMLGLPTSAAELSAILLGLVTGAGVRVVRDGVAGLVRQAPYGLLSLTPARLADVSSTVGREAATGLAGTIVVHGDAFPARVLEAWRALAPDVPVYHETHLLGGVCVFRAGASGWSARVPAGRPIPGVSAYVLGEDRELVPPGVAGELCFGGIEVVGEPSVAGPIDGERLRTTGKQARWLPDGQLDVLDEAAVSGVPVDVTALAAALCRQPGVRDAVVTVERGGLIAYYVAGQEVPLPDAVAALAAEVPAGVELAALHRISEIPTTSSGLVDRVALTAAVERRTPRAGGGSAPVGELELEIAGIWSDLLRVPVTDVTADFFEIGGQSLKAAQLRDRINARYAVELPLVTFFRARTVRALADRIGANR
ncbi:amino acid adenylation domain-containing protein [Amycolatopsis sp. lyj-346]|uniref:amino acid adenylation domain-containing protein n=1 Tax=Amycolatopsis sp. lyj-346 TaxID=2789289 RepID=UPI00397C9120